MSQRPCDNRGRSQPASDSDRRSCLHSAANSRPLLDPYEVRSRKNHQRPGAWRSSGTLPVTKRAGRRIRLARGSGPETSKVRPELQWNRVRVPLAVSANLIVELPERFSHLWLGSVSPYRQSRFDKSVVYRFFFGAHRKYPPASRTRLADHSTEPSTEIVPGSLIGVKSLASKKALIRQRF